MSETTIPAAAELLVEREIRVEATAERVWALLTDPREIARWMPMTTLDPRPGGEMLFSAGEWVAFGEVTSIDPGRSIGYTWDWRNAPIGARTEVTWEIEPDGDATVVRLRHVGFPAAELARNHREGWEHYVQRLVVCGAGGDPGPDTMIDAG